MRAEDDVVGYCIETGTRFPTDDWMRVGGWLASWEEVKALHSCSAVTSATAEGKLRILTRHESERSGLLRHRRAARMCSIPLHTLLRSDAIRFVCRPCVNEYRPTVGSNADSGQLRLVCNPVRYQLVRCVLPLLQYETCRRKSRGSRRFRTSEAEVCGILSVLGWLVFTWKTTKVLTIHVQ